MITHEIQPPVEGFCNVIIIDEMGNAHRCRLDKPHVDNPKIPHICKVCGRIFEVGILIRR